MRTNARVQPRRFCLVAPNPICWNPRLVKEADALSASGHDVRVLALAVGPRESRLDRAIASSRDWRLEQIDTDWNTPTGALRRGGWAVVERVARHAFEARFPSALVRDHAASRFLVPLAARAAAEPADLVIAHNLAALPAAARAARRLGARLGFDIEDLHIGELPDTPEHAPVKERVAAIERHYLPRCDYLTASSPGIADAIVELYGVRRPVVVLNAFPAEPHAAGAASVRERRSGAPALYWFSQTMGPDRGIEDALEALGRMSMPAHLYLRGAVAADYKSRILERARAIDRADRVHFLALVPPDELVARSSEHDVGLALEQPLTRNRDLCVTNKVFTYMLAGLAIAATETTGQRAVLAGGDVAAFFYRPGDVEALAQHLDGLLASSERLAGAKAKSRAAAAGEFSWDRQAEALVAYLESEPVSAEDVAPALAAAEVRG